MNSFFSMVVAHDEKRGIGKNGGMPWHLPEDLKWFQKITTETKSNQKKNTVIMGRKTYSALGGIYKPLPNRHNFVLSRSEQKIDAAETFSDTDKCLQKAFEIGESVFIIGGGEIYQKFISDKRCKNLYITKVFGQYDCDTFFPEYEDIFQNKEVILENEKFIIYRFFHL